MGNRNRRFDDLCDRYTEQLVRHLIQFGRLEQDARDLAQDALLATWKHIDRITPEAEWAYIRTAAHRLAINEAVRRPVGRYVPLDALGRAEAEPARAETQLIRTEQIERFRQDFHAGFSELPAETQQCFVLRRRGLGTAEVARLLGLHPTAVRTRLSRGMKHLREHVGPPPPGIEWAELTGENDDDYEK